MLDRAARGADPALPKRRLPPEIAFLAGRVPAEALAAAARRADQNGTAAQDELLTAGFLDPDGYARALAAHLGVAHRRRLDAPAVAEPLPERPWTAAARAGVMVAESGPQGVTLAIAARGGAVKRLVRSADARPKAVRRLVVTAPQAFADALLAGVGRGLAAAAAHTVDRTMAGLSARDRLVPWQARTLAAVLAALLAGTMLAPATGVLALLIVSSGFFLGVSGLRLAAVAQAAASGAPAARPRAPSNAELPVYTVLVPLYREANMARPLIAALDALDYPRAKLDIKLIVEADDAPTADALRALRLPPCYEIVTVPDALPKTKPKALNFALALARGSLVTIFDAEDCPEPDQLRRAAAVFRAAPPEVACLQARLAWYNWTDNWLTRQFAIEYAALFDVFLPALERLGLPLPLGGTSNHFRREALLRVGAWDAWNVTEDADLGMRLTRAGYRCRMLDATTWEEAPNRLAPWLRQRSRWLKGWLQTYFVHMRRPADFARQVGLRRFVAFQFLLGGMVASALVHPAFFLVLGAQVVGGDAFLGLDGWLTTTLIAAGAFNLAAGYGTGFALGLVALRRRPMRHLAGDLAWLPLYWLLISAAAYRAVWQFARRPFHWDKTAHGLARTVAPLPRLGIRLSSAKPPAR